MTPDDWHKGMENEAASVEDGEWAGEARRVAQLQKQGQVARLLIAVTLAYALLGSVLMMGSNAVSLGYGPPALHSFLFGFHLFPDFNLTPWFLIPILLTAVLVRGGVSKRLVWLVPVGGSLIGSGLARLVTVPISPNVPGIAPDVRVDLLPSGSGSAAALLMALGLNLLTVLLGLWLGQILRGHKRGLLV